MLQRAAASGTGTSTGSYQGVLGSSLAAHIGLHNSCVLLQVQWSKAARTDKGVSAVANVVACLLSNASLPDLVDRWVMTLSVTGRVPASWSGALSNHLVCSCPRVARDG